MSLPNPSPPYGALPTANHSLALDVTAVARASSLIAATQTAYNSFHAKNPGSPTHTIVLADVYTTSVRTGLNYWRPISKWRSPAWPAPGQPISPTFVPHAGIGVAAVVVAVWTADVTLATAIQTALAAESPPITAALDDILGAALCTGLARTAGLDQQEGPFA